MLLLKGRKINLNRFFDFLNDLGWNWLLYFWSPWLFHCGCGHCNIRCSDWNDRQIIVDKLLTSEGIYARIDVLIHFILLHHNWFNLELSVRSLCLLLLLLFFRGFFYRDRIHKLSLLLVLFVLNIVVKHHPPVFLLNDQSFFVLSQRSAQNATLEV